MEKIVTEIYRGVKEKASSPFLIYFTFSWIITNYSFLYFILFQDENIFYKTNSITKTEYLLNNSFYGNIWLSILCFLIIPILSSLFFIFIFPGINRKILKIYRENKNKDEILSQSFKLAEIDREIERNTKRIEEKKGELEIKETKNNIENIDKNSYLEEYSSLKNKDLFNYFGKIIEYSNLKKRYKDHRQEYIPENIISKYIGFGIVILDENDSTYITLTEKGKEFAHIFLEGK